ncbi:hypothetical protein TTHERM_00471980 (macronuclear) [Tetrahymena thermophila SB210]|uniref:Uncharacterized protein n=1 Tax=Tetrahymena thermophila (strain SB210) TaxID=312017 RepID=I7LTK5_TETTS|nr:hypothetical protein TTHERM_00471980 [Tetrahymena thermophila SB210]EAR85419.1 hypothetical protein TTHERM_00471980 [Tetrahymena thermophila SB210]|eukprot:XP_001033082.1 hypothetical protein TTHERM_00471980 [Tetrahymena thermophila SB210]
MGNEQSNNKYRRDANNFNQQKSKIQNQDLDNSILSTSVYQRKKQAQPHQLMFQPVDKNEMNISRRNQLDVSQSRVNRNKSSNLRNQVSFEDVENRSTIRSVSPNRSHLLVQSMRDIDRRSYRQRNKVQREEKIDIVRKTTDFCVDALLQNIDYENNSYINSLPNLTAMVSSQNLNVAEKSDENLLIKNIMKNKTKEEQHLRLNMKHDYPFSHEDKNRFSKQHSFFIDEKYDKFADKQLEQAASLINSKPYLMQSQLNVNESNLITLDPFKKDITISEIKAPNRQTFKPLVDTRQNELQTKINIKDLITTDQQLSAISSRKNGQSPLNNQIASGNTSPFSNLFQKAASTEKQEEKPQQQQEYIQIQKVNAEVLEDKTSKSLLLNTTSNYNSQKFESQLKPSYEYTEPAPIIKKTIEINERIIDNTLPNNPNYNSQIYNYDPSNRIPAAPKNQQPYFENKQPSQVQQTDYYQNQSYINRVDYNSSQILQEKPLRAGSNQDYERDQNSNLKSNQNNFYPTTQKLKIKVKKVEIPQNTDSEKYDTSSESEEDQEQSKNIKGVRLREYEKELSERKKKSKNNLNSANQSYLNTSHTNINKTENSFYNNQNRSNTPSYRNTNNNNNNQTTNNSFITYQQDLSPQNGQYTPYQQKYYTTNQEQQQPPSQFTTYQIENKNYYSNQNNIIQDKNNNEYDTVKRSRLQPQQNYNTPYQNNQQQNYNENPNQQPFYQPQNLNNQPQNYNKQSQNYNNYTQAPRSPHSQMEQPLNYSNNQTTYSPQFSQNYLPNNSNINQFQEQRDYPQKMIPFHLPDQREKAVQPQSLTPRNPDNINNYQTSTTPRSQRQPIFSNHSSKQNSIQMSYTQTYPEYSNQQNQPKQPILNKQAQNPQNFEKIIDIKLNESRTERRNPTPSNIINQSYTQRENINTPSTSQILNQSYTNINQSYKNQYNNEHRSITPPPIQRNENQTEKITTTTTVYQHGLEPNRSFNNNYNNYGQKDYYYQKENQKVNCQTQPINDIAPQQPYQTEKQSYSTYNQPPTKVQNIQSSITNTKQTQQNISYSRQNQPQEGDGTNIFIVDSPPQSQKEIALKRSLNNSRASSKNKKRKKTPGRKQNYQRSDNSSEDHSPNSSIYYEENQNISDDDLRDSYRNRQPQVQRKSQKNTSYSHERQSRKSNQDKVQKNSQTRNGQPIQPYNQEESEEDQYDQKTKKSKLPKRDQEQNSNKSHPYSQSKTIRTDMEQIQQIFQSTQEEQPPYDNYYDSKTKQPQNNINQEINYNQNTNQENRQNPQYNQSSTAQRQPNKDHYNQMTYQPKKMINNNHQQNYNQQESETEEDDLQQQPFQQNNFYKSPKGPSSQPHRNPQNNQEYQPQSYQKQPRQEKQNNSNNNQQQNQYNREYEQKQQISNSQPKYQDSKIQPKNINNNGSLRNNQNYSNTYRNETDSETDSGYPHQEIDKHVYPGNKSNSQSIIKKDNKNNSRILPHNINDSHLSQNNNFQQEDYNVVYETHPLQKQQSEVTLNKNYYQQNQKQNTRQQNPHQNNDHTNSQQPNYNNGSNIQQNFSNYPQNQQYQNYQQDQYEKNQLSKVKSESNFLRNDNLQNMSNPKQINQNSNLPKVLLNSKVKVKLPQNQNGTIPQLNQSQGKQMQQNGQQYQHQNPNQQQYARKPQNHNINDDRYVQDNYNEEQEEDDNQVLRMTLDLSNQNHANNRASNTLDLNDNEYEEPVKVQLTLEEIMKRDDSGFFENQDDLLNSDTSSQQANYINALNQNLQYQNKYIL